MMNIGTKVRTILAVATCLNTALMATDVTQFHNNTVNLIYRILSVVLNFVVVACVTWYNNDYTPIASEYTGAMRQAKTGDEAGVDVSGLDYLEDGDEDEKL